MSGVGYLWGGLGDLPCHWGDHPGGDLRHDGDPDVNLESKKFRQNEVTSVQAPRFFAEDSARLLDVNTERMDR